MEVNPCSGRPVLALPVHHVLAPQPVQQVVVLQRERQPLADVLAEPRVDRGGVAAADHQVHPALGQVLEHRVLLGDPHRVVGRDQRGRRGDDEALGRRRDVGQQGGRRAAEEGRVVVLADGEHVHADFLGLLRDLHHRVDALRLARRVVGGRVAGDVADREESELHGRPPRDDICVCMYRKQTRARRYSRCPYPVGTGQDRMWVTVPNERWRYSSGSKEWVSACSTRPMMIT